MVYPADLKSDWEVLNNISNIASSLSQTLSGLDIPIIKHPLPDNFDSLIPHLILTVPHHILSPLSTIHVPESARTAILQSMDRFIVELQQSYNSKYRHTCVETFRITNSIDTVNSVHQTYQALVQKRFLPAVQSHVAFIVTEVAKRQSVGAESKRLFNNNFIPALEKYFDLNGYPSISHRSILAVKSKMVPRQIEVWFQNHRRRAKQEGKIVPRLGSDLPLRLALSTMEEEANHIQHRLPTPSEEDTEHELNGVNGKGVNASTRTTILGNSVTKPPTFLDDCYDHRPPHAFPVTKRTQYPDPFPTEEGIFKFAPPIWRRKPATIPIVSVDVDMEDFSSLFHLKLNFAENSRRRGTTPSKHESSPFQPWFSSTTFFCSPSPHPALIREPASLQRPFISISSSGTLIHNAKFGASSLPRSVSHPSATPGGSASRKIRPLPRRIPHSRPNMAVSRHSSFSSDTSSASRTSSSSNYSSSPELSTPPPLPDLELPTSTDGINQGYLLNASHSELDTDISFPSFLHSPDLDSVYTCPATSNKFIDMPFFDYSFPEFGHDLGEILF